MKTLTTKNLRELMLEWDVNFVVETLNLTSEDILDRFEDVISDRYWEIMGEVEALSEDDDDDEEDEQPNLDREPDE